MTWTIYKRGDPDERKREVWREHKATGLDDTLRELVETFGPPDVVAIRRRE